MGAHAEYMHALFPHKKGQSSAGSLSPKEFPLSQRGTMSLYEDKGKRSYSVICFPIKLHLMLMCILPILAILGLLILGSGWVSFSYHVQYRCWTVQVNSQQILCLHLLQIFRTKSALFIFVHSCLLTSSTNTLPLWFPYVRDLEKFIHA